jgi:hypothetical protein
MSSLQQDCRKGKNRFFMEVRGGGEEKEGVRDRSGPNNVYTYE